MNCAATLQEKLMHFYGEAIIKFVVVNDNHVVILPFCRLYRAYHKLYASMHDTEVGPYKTQFRRDENYGM